MAVDKHIIQGCIERKIRFQRKLYDLCLDRVYFSIRRYVSDQFFIENIAQDTFIKIFQHIDRYDPKIAKFETWISAIAVRETINHLRKRKFEFSDIGEVTNLKASTESGLHKLQAEDVLRTLDELPRAHRTVFSLYEIDGFSHREIGEMLHINESTSRSYLTRAKIIFRENLIKQKYITHGE